ncbi:MAG TPA: hypothetical protein VGO93_29800 [Candidatus Xenobia bacterium]
MRIELVGLSKSFNSRRVLDRLSLTFEPAHCGPHRCLATLPVSTEGTILLDGHELQRDRVDLRQRMAFLPDVPPFSGT